MTVAEFIAAIEALPTHQYEQAMGLTLVEVNTLLAAFMQSSDRTKILKTDQEKLYAILLTLRYQLSNREIGDHLLQSTSSQKRNGTTFRARVAPRLTAAVNQQEQAIQDKVAGLQTDRLEAFSLNAVLDKAQEAPATDADPAPEKKRTQKKKKDKGKAKGGKKIGKDPDKPKKKKKSKRAAGKMMGASGSSKPSSSVRATADVDAVNITFLGFDDCTIELASLLMVAEPQKGSGDIYHVVAYFILSQHCGRPMPTALTMYDIKPDDDNLHVITVDSKLKTYHHAFQRSFMFLNGLGFGDHVDAVEIPVLNMENATSKAGKARQNARLKSARQYLASHHAEDYYVNQRAATTLITHFFQQNGFEASGNIIADALAAFRTSDGLSDAEKTTIADYGANCVKEITDMEKACAGLFGDYKGFVVFHVRFSKDANPHQNLDKKPIVKQTIQYLATQGYLAVVIYADSRCNKKSARERETRIRLPDGRFYQACYFQPFFPKSDELVSTTTADDGTEHQRDLGKFLHLELLLQLKAMNNCIGVIGNTSGTLDIAALMGHRVLNIHNFQTGLDYQDYRLLLQVAFLTIVRMSDWERTELTRDNETYDNDFLLYVSQWLTDLPLGEPQQRSLQNQFPAFSVGDTDQMSMLFKLKRAKKSAEFASGNDDVADIPVAAECQQTSMNEFQFLT